MPRFEDTPVKQNNSNGLLILIIVILLAFFAHDKGYIEINTNPDKPDVVDVDPVVPTVVPDNKVEPDAVPDKDPDKAVSKHDANNMWAFRIGESKNTRPKWLNDQFNNEKFWIREISSKGIKVRTPDPYLDDGTVNPQVAKLLKAAKDRGVSAPFLLITEGINGEVLHVEKFSEGDLAEKENHWRKTITQFIKE